MIAFTLSLLVTGLGQVYCGSASRGIVLMLLRVVSVIAVPCYGFINPGENMLTEIFIAVSAFLLITISSPAEALVRAYLSRQTVKQKYNRYSFYISFTIVNIILTLFSISVFFTVFELCVNPESQRPLFIKGDILAVNRINIPYRSGETVMGQNCIPVRVTGLPGESVIFSNGRFSINGSELPRSIYSETELSGKSLWDNDVVLEQNGNSSYAVVPSKKNIKLTATPGKNEYYTAPDDRNMTVNFGVLTADSIKGRIEGIFFSPARRKFLITSY